MSKYTNTGPGKGPTEHTSKTEKRASKSSRKNKHAESGSKYAKLGPGKGAITRIMETSEVRLGRFQVLKGHDLAG